MLRGCSTARLPGCHAVQHSFVRPAVRRPGPGDPARLEPERAILSHAGPRHVSDQRRLLRHLPDRQRRRHARRQRSDRYEPSSTSDRSNGINVFTLRVENCDDVPGCGRAAARLPRYGRVAHPGPRRPSSTSPRSRSAKSSTTAWATSTPTCSRWTRAARHVLPPTAFDCPVALASCGTGRFPRPS